MAAYPSYSIALESRQRLENTHADDFDEQGGHHAREMHDQQYYHFELVHYLTLAQWDSLLATYAAGPRDVYTLTYYSHSPIETYSVRFTEPPAIVRNHGNGIYEVEANLRGSKD